MSKEQKELSKLMDGYLQLSHQTKLAIEKMNKLSSVQPSAPEWQNLCTAGEEVGNLSMQKDNKFSELVLFMANMLVNDEKRRM